MKYTFTRISIRRLGEVTNFSNSFPISVAHPISVPMMFDLRDAFAYGLFEEVNDYIDYWMTKDLEK